MGLITDDKPAGFYYVGYVTQKSLESMPAELRERFPLNTAMMNKTPFRTRQEARRVGRAHHLRDIQVVQN